MSFTITCAKKAKVQIKTKKGNKSRIEIEKEMTEEGLEGEEVGHLLENV